MAFSASRLRTNLMGASKVHIYNLNFASVTEGTFKTGLSNVDHASFENNTTEGQGLVKLNTSTGSNSAPGDIYISGVTSSDVGTIIVVGV